jgi:hypothetical protein
MPTWHAPLGLLVGEAHLEALLVRAGLHPHVVQVLGPVRARHRGDHRLLVLVQQLEAEGDHVGGQVPRRGVPERDAARAAKDVVIGAGAAHLPEGVGEEMVLRR